MSGARPCASPLRLPKRSPPRCPTASCGAQELPPPIGQKEAFSAADAIDLGGTLAELGAAYVDVTSGGITPKIRVAVSPGYQVPFAAEIKRAIPRLVVRAVGMIVTPTQAQAVVESGQADQVAIARAVLDDPRWGWHAAEALGVEIRRPPQYQRAAPSLWPGGALARPSR